MKKNAVTIVCQLFYPELVSTGQTVTELAEAIQKEKVQVNVICAQPTLLGDGEKVAREITHKGIKITRVWSTNFPKSNLLGKLINHITYSLSTFFFLLISKDKHPILSFTNPPFIGWICAAISAIKKRPFIYVLFDLYPDTAIASGLMNETALISKTWQKLNEFTYSQADKVIVLGRCMMQVLNRTFPTDMKHKLHLIRVWADDININQNTHQINFRDAWNLSEKFVLLYSGNLARFHDIETILAAAERLQINQNIQFLFVGEGYKKKAAQSFVESKGLRNVQFKNYVDRSELGNLLQMADIGLVSLLNSQLGLSVPSKTFGLLSAGLPIIGVLPSESEISLILKEENCGFVSKPGDVESLVQNILELYEQEKLRTDMGKNARKAIDEKYNLKKTTAQYVTIIENLTVSK